MSSDNKDNKPASEKQAANVKSNSFDEYRYRLTIRPFSIGTQPNGHLRHEDDGSPYGVVVYDHPLTRQEAENFSLTPLTEAKELEGKSFEVPFGKGTLKYQVDSVDENGRVKFLINGAHERSLPYYKFLDEIGEKAKEVAEEAHHDATEKQNVGEKILAEIEAAWKKRILDYIKEHYPAISERSENSMAQRIASRKDKVLTEMRNKAELEITAMKDKEGVFGERVPVVSGDFPKGLPEYKVITMKQKGGKNSTTENVYVAMVDGDLYIKRHVKGDVRRNVSIRIPNVKQYGANEIVYRLDLGIGTSTDAVRLMGDAILELYKKEGLRFEKAEGASAVSPSEAVLRDALVDIMHRSGLDVTMNEEAQRVLDEANGIGAQVRLQAKLSSLAKAAKTMHNWIARKAQGKVFTIELPEATRRMIRNVMGRDFDSHNITSNGIRHGLNNHGVDGKKLNESSIPIRDEDAELIPYIMTAPDYVKKGSEDVTRRESIRFYKY